MHTLHALKSEKKPKQRPVVPLTPIPLAMMKTVDLRLKNKGESVFCARLFIKGVVAVGQCCVS